MEELPITKEALIVQYQKEKEKQLMMNENKDYLKERAVENSVLFKKIHHNSPGLLMSVLNKLKINQNENIGEEKRELSGKKDNEFKNKMLNLIIAFFLSKIGFLSCLFFSF